MENQQERVIPGIVKKADRIKEKGIKIYTVGFALNDKTKAWLAGGKDGNTPYKGIASKDCALTADNIDQLKTIFKELQQTMTQSLDIKPAQIKDVIDPRFTIIGDDKKPITQDYTVTKNGTTYNTETGIPLSNGGTVYYGEFEQKDANGNVVKDANGNPVKKTYQYIVWNDETIPNKTKGEWHKTMLLPKSNISVVIIFLPTFLQILRLQQVTVMRHCRSQR